MWKNIVKRDRKKIYNKVINIIKNLYTIKEIIGTVPQIEIFLNKQILSLILFQLSIRNANIYCCISEPLYVCLLTKSMNFLQMKLKK